jgi:hypothetical protein
MRRTFLRGRYLALGMVLVTFGLLVLLVGRFLTGWLWWLALPVSACIVYGGCWLNWRAWGKELERSGIPW